MKPPAASSTRRALSLTAYLTYARGGGAASAPEPLRRPSGPLVWAHADSPQRGRALASLCGRLRLQRPEVTTVHSGALPAQAEAMQVTLPGEHPGECEAFVTAMKPDVLLWAGQRLRPALLHAAAASGCTLIGLDAADAAWPTDAPRWLPDPASGALSLFSHVFTQGNAASRRLRRMGVSGPVLHEAAPLLDTAPPLDCPESLHEEMATTLTGRPVWLAAHLRAEEIGDVLSAHRHAVRLAHRLLLIVVPATARDEALISRAVRGSQMRVCDWDSGEMPDEYTQILLATSPDELGLWYRLAPLAFLGGSLTPGIGGQDPFEAASPGAAILYGPNVGKHLDSYSLLVEAGAARIVRDADSLGTAVSHLVAPDQAASMAHAGWDVISSRAALVDEVLTLVGDVLDAKRSA